MPQDLTPEIISPRATQRDTVVLGDQLVFKIDISAVYGYLSEEHDDDAIAGLINNENEGISLQITGYATLVFFRQ